MKKITISLLMLFLTVLLCSCACEHEFDSGVISVEATCTVEGVKTYTCTLCDVTKTEPVELKPHSYEGKVIKEATFTEEGEMEFACISCTDSYTETIPVRDDVVEIVVTDKVSIPEDIDAWRFSDFVSFDFKVINHGEKDIKGIQGILKIKNLFGEDIISFRCDFTGKTVKVGKSVEFEGLGIDINPFLEDEVELYNEKYDDLNFEYEISSIVYTDGSVDN